MVAGPRPRRGLNANRGGRYGRGGSGVRVSGDQVTYTSTWQDVLAANRLRIRPARGRRLAAATLALIGAADVALGVLLLPDGGMSAIAIGLLLVLAYPAWRLLLWWWLPRLARRYYQQAAVLREPITVGWGPDGLSTRSPHVTSALPWSAYVGRLEDDAVMLFFQTDAMF